MTRPPIFGLLLAGGKSRRMGGIDKALLRLTPDAPNQIERGAALLRNLCPQVFLSSRPDQKLPLPEGVQPLHDNEAFPEGPLRGILTALHTHPEAHWLVAACDMPCLTPEVLGELCSAFAAEDTPVPTAAALSSGALPEPLCAIYPAGSGSRLAALAREGQTASPRQLLCQIKTRIVQLSDAEALTNMNTPADAAKLRATRLAMASPPALEYDPAQARIRAIYLSKGHDFKGRHGKGRLTHPVESVDEVACVEGRGLVGDRFFDYKENFKGQITFFDWAVVDALRHAFPDTQINPADFRRNILTEGLPLNALINRRFTLQGIEFEGTESCAPCYWMDTAFTTGMEQAMQDKGGLRARILSSGTLRVSI